MFILPPGSRAADDPAELARLIAHEVGDPNGAWRVMPRIHSDNFVLINLEGRDSFVFDLFPKEIQGTDRANWEPQDVTIGMKPLFYANREPRRVSVPELYLDGTRTGESVNDQIDALRSLKDELPSIGRPPALLAVWGARQQRCVLEEVTITEELFWSEGNPMRARVSLQLLELQEQREAVHSTVKDVADIDPRRDIGAKVRTLSRAFWL